MNVNKAGSSSELPIAHPDNLPARDAHFQGRTDELDKLRSLLQQGAVGGVVACQGLGGQGKTALALEFAHRYTADYPGGRAKLDAESHEHLHTLLRQLVSLLFHPDPRAQEELKPVLALPEEAFLDWLAAELRRRPRLLLLLDNVDRTALLARGALDRLPGPEHLHLVVTTRLEPAALHLQRCVEVDKLPLDDAVELLRSHRELADRAEQEAARDLVTRLDGYTIAVEATAVWLAEHPALTLREFCAQLIAGGLKKFEDAPRADQLRLSRHKKSQLSVVLAPMLDSLPTLERRVLEYAALLPADCIPLPWLRELVKEQVPAEGGFEGDPWQACAQRLDGLRLLRTADATPDAIPRLARMHRLVQEILAPNRAALMPALIALAESRAVFLSEGWVDRAARWEIEPLRRLALYFLELGERTGAALANWLCMPLRGLGLFATSEELLHTALAWRERHLPTDLPELATTLSNLAEVEQDLGNLPEARRLLLRAIEIEEKHFDADHPNLAIRYSNLALVEKALGNLPEARRLLLRAIEIEEKHFDSDHPNLAIRYSNLAMVEQDLGNLSEARRLLLRAIEIEEKHFDSDHPNLATSYSNLALVEKDSGNLPEARRLLLRAIEIGEKHFDSDHPTLATRYSNLAVVELALGNLPEARRLLLRAIEIGEKHFDPDHPTLATFYSNLAVVERALGNLPEARRLLLRAEKILLSKFGPDHADTQLVRRSLAELG